MQNRLSFFIQLKVRLLFVVKEIKIYKKEKVIKIKEIKSFLKQRMAICIKLILVLIMMLLPIVTTVSEVYAASISVTNIDDFLVYQTGPSNNASTKSTLTVTNNATGESIRDRLAILKVGSEVVYCIEPFKKTSGGYEYSATSDSLGNVLGSLTSQHKIEALSYFGYGYNGDNSLLAYGATQIAIWEWQGYTVSDITSEMRNMVNTIKTRANNNLNSVKPSFNGTTIELTGYGEANGVTLTDSNGVFSDYHFVSNNGFQYKKSGNTLKIWVDSFISDGTIKYQSINPNDSSRLGNSIVYINPNNAQTVSSLRISDPKTITINVKINKNYQVAFNGNTSSSGSMTNQTFTYNQAQNLKSNSYSKLGHTFGGWNTKADGSGTNYSNGQSVNNLTIPNTVFNLYAKWVNTKPEITTPVITNPNEETNSNIPPYIEGGKLIIQKGDKLDVVKYFTANDKEDGNITSKIVITDNPVPLDSNKITTKAGEYVVTASVTDLGGLTTTGKLTVIVNDPPVIEAQDRWFLQDQTVDRDNLLSQVVATDLEDGDLITKVVIDYIKYSDGTVINNPTSFDTTFVNETGVDDIKETVSEIKYTVTDKYKAGATTTAKLYVSRDIQKFEPKRKTFIRYINLEFIDTLDATSIWRTDSTLKNRLLSSLSKTNPSQAKAVYSFTHDDVQEIKTWLRDNKPSQTANQEYITRYLNPHKTRGGVD